jgi:hypothetical protein
MLYSNNKKLWEELIAFFPTFRHSKVKKKGNSHKHRHHENRGNLLWEIRLRYMKFSLN